MVKENVKVQPRRSPTPDVVIGENTIDSHQVQRRLVVVENRRYWSVIARARQQSISCESVTAAPPITAPTCDDVSNKSLIKLMKPPVAGGAPSAIGRLMSYSNLCNVRLLPCMRLPQNDALRQVVIYCFRLNRVAETILKIVLLAGVCFTASTCQKFLPRRGVVALTFFRRYKHSD